MEQLPVGVLTDERPEGCRRDPAGPFEVEDHWFALELVEFQVVAGEALPSDVATAVEDTIERLRLNDLECCKARLKFAEDYWEHHISFDYLTRHVPFVARELQRQAKLRDGDR